MTLLAQQLQFRRGTSSEDDAFTGLVGEPTWDTDTKVLRIHDGSTVGGVKIAKLSDVPTKTSDLTNDSGFLTSHQSLDGYVPTSRTVNGKALTGNISLTASDVGALSSSTTIPSKTSDLTNDSGFLTSHQSLAGYVPTSRTVNGKALSANISLTASDVGALPSNTTIPTKTSDLTNDSGFLTSHQSLSGYLPLTAGSTKPLTGQLHFTGTGGDSLGYVASNQNNRLDMKFVSGNVDNDTRVSVGGNFLLGEFAVLKAGYTGDPSNKYSAVEADGTLQRVLLQVKDGASEYNVSLTNSGFKYNNKRILVEDDLTGLAQSSSIPTKVSDLTNDSGFISGITSSDVTTALGYTPLQSSDISSVYKYKGTKTNYSDLPSSGNTTGDVWNVTNANGNIPAGTNYSWTGSAWDALGGSVDLSSYALSSAIPTRTSDLANDSGFLTASDLPGSTSELLNDSGYITSLDIPTNVSDFANDAGYITSASLPTKTSDLTNDSGYITSASLPTDVSDLNNDAGYITSASLPTKTSDLTNDSGFLTSHQSLSGYYTKTEIDNKGYLTQHQSLSGYVPTSRKVNNKALSADITLSASDVSAVPTTRKVNNKALSADITLSASDVGALASDGNAASATEFSAAKSVTLSGAVTGTASSKAGWSITTVRRSCLVGQNGSTSTNPWYKFATFTIANNNDDREITFLVTDTYSNTGNKFGILRAHLRNNGSKVIEVNNSSLEWLINTGYDESQFVMCCNNAAGSTAELWTSIPYAYKFRRFSVLSEGGRASTASTWTLLDASSAGQAASYTAADNVIVSTNTGKINGHTVEKDVPSSAVFTDTKVSVTELSTDSDNYSEKNVLIKSGSLNANGTEGAHWNRGLRIHERKGTASRQGNLYLALGNNVATGSENNMRGTLRLFSPKTSYADIVQADVTSSVTHTFPATGGTVINSGTITNYVPTTVGDTNTPVYVTGGKVTSTGKSFADYLPLSGGTVSGIVHLNASSMNIDAAQTSQKEDWMFVGEKSSAQTNNKGALWQFGAYQFTNTQNYFAGFRIGNPRNDNLPASGTNVRTSNAWDGIGIKYWYAQNTGYGWVNTQPPLSTSHPNYDANHIATVGNLKTAIGDYLPLAGGTVTGQIKTSYTDILVKTDDTGHIAVCGGSGYSNGASILLRGKSESAGNGWWQLRATDGTNDQYMIGKPDGTLTWGGSDIYVENRTNVSTVGPAITRSGTGNWLRFTGGETDYDDGASVIVFGRTHSSNAGVFTLSAYNGTNRYNLTGAPSGNLTWGGSFGASSHITTNTNLYLKYPSYTRGTPPSANEFNQVQMQDKNGAALGKLQFGRYASGSLATHLVVNRPDTGAENVFLRGEATSSGVFTVRLNSGRDDGNGLTYNGKPVINWISANTTKYVSKDGAGTKDGSSAANAMSLDDMRWYLQTLQVTGSTSDYASSYTLTLAFVPLANNASYGNISFDANKMPGIRNITVTTSTGTNGTLSNLTTNCPRFGQFVARGCIYVDVRNVQVDGDVIAEYGARLNVSVFISAGRFIAQNFARMDVGASSNSIINIVNRNTNYAFYSTERSSMYIQTATTQINFQNQCYYTNSIFSAFVHGNMIVRYDRIKFTGTKPIVIFQASGTLTATCSTAAGTAAKVATLESGQSFTLATNATAKVKFTVTNTAANPTLNINNTGAKTLRWNGANVPAGMLWNGAIYDVKYDGTYYVIQQGGNRVENWTDYATVRKWGTHDTTYNSGSFNFSGWSLNRSRCFDGSDLYGSTGLNNINKSGDRGTLSGYETVGSATTINDTCADANSVNANVTVSNGTSGKAWTKIVYFQSAKTVTLGTNWKWANNDTPTIVAGGILVCTWCGAKGIASFLSPS